MKAGSPEFEERRLHCTQHLFREVQRAGGRPTDVRLGTSFGAKAVEKVFGENEVTEIIFNKFR